jgi:ABC-type dipeptide/oligopeptide/nickel transport system permease component
MAVFVVRRLLWTIPILWIVVTTVFSVVLGLAVMVALLIVLANLAVNVAHRALDPRLCEA